MDNLFVIHPGLQDKKVIILGTGRTSLLLFSVLLQNDIYVSNFLASYGVGKSDICIMNKSIITEEEAEQLKSEAVIVAAGQELLEEAERLIGKGYKVFFDYNFTAYEGDSILIEGTQL